MGRWYLGCFGLYDVGMDGNEGGRTQKNLGPERNTPEQATPGLYLTADKWLTLSFVDPF